MIEISYLEFSVTPYSRLGGLKVENKKHHNWGGKRLNAGRKPKLEKVESKTKPCRISIHHCNLIKSGKLTEIENLLSHWHQKQKREPKSQSSPRWAVMNQFLRELESILEEDSRLWIEPMSLGERDADAPTV